ncbi:MAG: hypothetical protein IH616_09510 [Gemmatimonadales bacterium]|nr:hypothetical protein [Gemmatimonadales bacterium]
MRIAAIISIAALFIAGCTTAPPLPQIESARGDRIGILVETGDNPTHTHIGTTVFNNFTREYPYDWKLSTEVTRTIERVFGNAGFTAVDLRKEGLSYADVSDLIQPTGEKWQVATGKEETIRRLREQLKLKALLVAKEASVLANIECSGGPCSERYVAGPGLYSRSFLGLSNYYAVAAYQWNVFVLDPVADAAKVDPLWSMLRIPSAHLREFQHPLDFRNLTEAEFAPVREAVLMLTEKASHAAVKSLNVR